MSDIGAEDKWRELQEFIAALAFIAPSQLRSDATLQSDLGLDSLALTEVMAFVAVLYAVELPAGADASTWVDLPVRNLHDGLIRRSGK